ncbi:hypothetical protein V6N13_043072 [Hibiscus sabdariffa]
MKIMMVDMELFGNLIYSSGHNGDWKGIVLYDDEVLDNKGLINEASIERMIRGKYIDSKGSNHKQDKEGQGQKVVNEKDEDEGEDIVEEIVNASKVLDANAEKKMMEQEEARPVLLHISNAADDIGVELETKELSKDCAKPKEKRRNLFKDKKHHKEKKKRRKKKHRAAILWAEEL